MVSLDELMTMSFADLYHKLPPSFTLMELIDPMELQRVIDNQQINPIEREEYISLQNRLVDGNKHIIKYTIDKCNQYCPQSLCLTSMHHVIQSRCTANVTHDIITNNCAAQCMLFLCKCHRLRPSAYKHLQMFIDNPSIYVSTLKLAQEHLLSYNQRHAHNPVDTIPELADKVFDVLILGSGSNKYQKMGVGSPVVKGSQADKFQIEWNKLANILTLSQDYDSLLSDGDSSESENVICDTEMEQQDVDVTVHNLRCILYAFETVYTTSLIESLQYNDIVVHSYKYGTISVSGNIDHVQAVLHKLQSSLLLKHTVNTRVPRPTDMPLAKAYTVQHITWHTPLDAAQSILHRYAKHFLCIGKEVYIRQHNVYLLADRARLSNFVSLSPLIMKKTNGIHDNQKHQHTNISSAIVTAIKHLVASNAKYRCDMHTVMKDNVGLIHYNDCIYDMRTHHCRSYTDDDITFSQLDRSYPKCIDADCVEFIKQHILSVIEPSQIVYFLQCVSRNMAGHINDKNWYVWLGDNAGKHALQLLFLSTFCTYTTTTKAPIGHRSESNVSRYINDGCAVSRMAFTCAQSARRDGTIQLDCELIDSYVISGCSFHNHKSTFNNAVFHCGFSAMPEFSSIETLKNCRVIRFPKIQDVTPFDIKTILTNSSMLDAFASIVYSHYMTEMPLYVMTHDCISCTDIQYIFAQCFATDISQTVPVGKVRQIFRFVAQDVLNTYLEKTWNVKQVADNYIGLKLIKDPYPDEDYLQTKGYIYLLRMKTDMGVTVFKSGMTRRSVETRISEYKPHPCVLLSYETNDCNEAERSTRTALRAIATIYEGNEYFVGDEELIRAAFTNIMTRYRNKIQLRINCAKLQTATCTKYPSVQTIQNI